jgi:type II secretory pathway component PulK
MRIVLRHKKNQDGIAIFIVLVSILVLASMAGIFAYNMRVETKLAMNSNNETEMEWLGRSGVELARYVLGQEMATPGPGQRFDALNQKWAGGQGETNDVLADIILTDVPLGSGKFSVTIKDAERKININTAANNQALMTEALTLVGADASEIPTIIDSIQDWIDPDSETHVNGAESDYYQSLNPPYSAKNGPVDDLSELLLVKGVTPEIYWGPNSTNHQLSIFQQRPLASRSGLLASGPMVSMGMVDLFTPVSNGRININTCSANTLRAIGMDESSAQHLISMRSGPDGVDGTEDDVPFSNPGEIINAGLPPQIVSMFTPYLTVRSSTFEVQVDVTVGQSPPRHYHALLLRNSPRDIQILSFNWE